MITVKIGKLPGTIRDIALPPGSNVAAAIEAAAIKAPIAAGDVGGTGGWDVRVNAEEATPDTRLADGDTVLLVKKIKGN
jgi:hypothetical protein